MILPVAFLHEEIKDQAVQVNAVNAFNYSGKATRFFVNGKEKPVAEQAKSHLGNARTRPR